MSWAVATSSPRSSCPGFPWTRPMTSLRSWRTRWRTRQITGRQMFSWRGKEAIDAKIDECVCGGRNPLDCPQKTAKHYENDLTNLFVSVSDLLQHPDVVPQGAVWVQVHADGPQLVQLLLRSTDTQGESSYRLNDTVTRVTSATDDNKNEKTKQRNTALKRDNRIVSL